MPHYKCPVTTCNVTYEGSVFDIVLPAVMHGEGSHNMYLSDEDVAQIIEKQASQVPDGNLARADTGQYPPRMESAEEFLPKEEVPPPDIEDYRVTKQYDWWKRV